VKLRMLGLGAVGLAVVSMCSSALAAVEGYYRWATISGDNIVFTSEADLWKVPASGGLATRLTSHPANEVMPRFSPDGKQIAFTGDYLSAGDVYVISADGGEPKRLTFHPANDQVIGWTSDGSGIFFRSRRSGRGAVETLFKVPAQGGEPEVVNIGPASQVSPSPDGKMLAFNRHSWSGTWKRYRGGTAPEIWIADLANNKFWELTKDDAVDQTPMWIGDRVFFLSERAGPVNIFSAKPDGSDVKQHTRHADYDVRYAATDGKRIVYTLGADLYVFDPKIDAGQKVNVMLPSDRIRQQPRVEEAAKTLESWDLSDDGKKVTASSRGEVWATGTKPGGLIAQVTDQAAGTRERAAVFSPDGKQIALITDESGEQELAIYDAKGNGQHKVITKRGKGWLFSPLWAPDGKRIAMADMTGMLFLVDPTSGDVKEVDQDKNWEITQYTFSPDGKWLAYRKVGDNRMEQVWLYNVESGQKATISNPAGASSDYSPTFDPEGKYLFFLSNRSFNPYLDDFDREFIVTKTAKPCAVILQKDGKSPFLPDELLDKGDKDDKDKDEAKDEKKDDDEKKSDAEKKDEKKKDEPRKLTETKIDLEGIELRVVEFPVSADNYADLRAAKDRVFYLKRPMRGLNEPGGDDDDMSRNGRDDAKVMVYDFKKKKEDTYVDGTSGYDLSDDAKRIGWRKGKEILITDASSKPGDDLDEKVKLDDLPLQVDTAKEWRQIFAEAWRLQRDFYWAENMVGVDWPAMRKKYEPLVNRCATRGELNDVIGQLIGELGTSHTYVFGGDTSFKPPTPIAVGVLGADIEMDKASGLHRFARVLRPEPWETDVKAPLTLSHANVKDGDYLVAINGRELKPTESVDERLQNLAGKQVLLTVASKADKSDARDVQIETLNGDSELRYADWCRRNREYVAEKSSGKIGYYHLPDMGGQGLVKFIQGFYPQIDRDGMLIDARDNGGGFVSQMMIERLERKPLHYDRPRRGLIGTYPDRTHLGHKAVLINEFAGSDGDIFPDTFRKLGLGPLIGKRTWGGVIGIRMDKAFVDAGISSQPEFAWFDMERGWDIENVGVTPDIEVDYRPEDWIAGRDPQLERGIEELMKKIEKEPVKRPTPPPFPNRAPKNNAPNGNNGNAQPAAATR
jgi:tricorn protease